MDRVFSGMLLLVHFVRCDCGCDVIFSLVWIHVMRLWDYHVYVWYPCAKPSVSNPCSWDIYPSEHLTHPLLSQRVSTAFIPIQSPPSHFVSNMQWVLILMHHDPGPCFEQCDANYSQYCTEAGYEGKETG